MKGKIRKKIVWNDEGVSEIIGDVMILIMTTVLFASVFAFVWSLPTPDEDLYAAFESSLDLNGSGGTINITHLGGETLKGMSTAIYLYQNIDEEIRILNTQGSDADNPDYGIEGDENWDTGETWEYYHSGINGEDDVRLSIIDTKTSRVILDSTLQGKVFNVPPLIMERWSNTNPAINQSQVTIFAKVVDYNGCSDITSVFFNASKLNASFGNIEMTDPDGDCIFQADVNISTYSGEYILDLFAVDSENESGSARLNLEVVESIKPIIEFVAIEPNSVEVEHDFTIRALVVDLNGDLNLSGIDIMPEQKFFDDGGTIETTFDLEDEIPFGGIFETTGDAPKKEGNYELILKATDHLGSETQKEIELAVIVDDTGLGNDSFNDSIWAYLGPESLDFKKFYYTTSNPPTNSTEYHFAVFVKEEHIGDDCYFHINVINHYYEDVYIDGNSKVRLLQIGGAASNKDIEIVQNGSDFGDPVGKTPDGTWYKIPKADDGDYFHGGDPVSLVFGPFDLQSAKEGDVFGSILVLTGSYGSEDMTPENRLGQTLPFQAIVID
jgi:hypothetical protein